MTDMVSTNYFKVKQDTLPGYWDRTVSLLNSAVYRRAFRRTKPEESCQVTGKAWETAARWAKEKYRNCWESTMEQTARIRLLSIHNSAVNLHPSWDYPLVSVLLPVLTWLSKTENRCHKISSDEIKERNEQRMCFTMPIAISQSYNISTQPGNILRGFSYLVYSKYCNSCVSSELESPVLYKIQVENSSFRCIFHSSATALVTKREKKSNVAWKKSKPSARRENI